MAAHIAGRDARVAELLRTGALYGMVHAAALLGVAALAGRDTRPDLPLAIAGWAFAAGLVLFSGSLYALALARAGWLAALTPFGGAALLLGWVALALDAILRRV